eukprot:Em0020g1069a
MGASRFISRKHVEIMLDRNNFYLLCRGKNGVFVDDIFQKRENKRMQLPNSCMIRFPSTQIKLSFTSLLEDMTATSSVINPPSPLPPAKFDLSPFVTPLPSPTGTISAVNSCPASPNSMEHRGHPVPSLDIMAKYASKLHVLASTTAAVTPEQGASDKPSSVTGEEDDDPTPPPSTSHEEPDQPDKQEDKSSEKHSKPPYSYAQLIVQALLSAKDRKQTLSGIYQFISEKYPYYRMEDKGWKNSIRHNLSLNQYFMKAPREKEGLGFGKGGYWCMHPDYEEKLTSQAYVKRKKKGIPVFPSAGLMSTRSAPPSPTHHTMAISGELTFRDNESSYVLSGPPNAAQFSLPQYLPQLAGSMSHSLPGSPSRPPPTSFSVTPLRFFPLSNMRSSSTEALALERPQLKFHAIQEEEREEPLNKKPKMATNGCDGLEEHSIEVESMGGMVVESVGEAAMKRLQSSKSSLPIRLSGQNTLPFSLPLIGMSQNNSLLTQPLSSFLPQNFFATTSNGVQPDSKVE